MTEPEPREPSQIEIELMRQIDAVCRRYEAAWREGRQSRIEDYLTAVPEAGRSPLRAELEDLSQGPSFGDRGQ